MTKDPTERSGVIYKELQKDRHFHTWDNSEPQPVFRRPASTNTTNFKITNTE